MKKLGVFVAFDWARFARDKIFTATGTSPWKDQQGNVLGTRVEAAITQDNTDYGDTTVSNLYEKVTIKVPKPGVIIPIGAVVEPVNPVATVYGEFRNLLSIKAADVKVVGQPSGGKS